MSEKPDDISSNARSVARTLDRLPPGEHTIYLSKRRDEWDIEIENEHGHFSRKRFRRDEIKVEN